jgi:mono/diheme cytochrome c family protein
MRWLLTTLAAAALATAMAGAAEPASSDAAAARKIYTAKCARCHKFYDPAAYDEVKWLEWMTKMRRKSRLAPEEYDTLMRFLGSLRTASK